MANEWCSKHGDVTSCPCRPVKDETLYRALAVNYHQPKEVTHGTVPRA